MGYGEGKASVAETGTRSVVLASADRDFCHRLGQLLTAMRWDVREAGGGAEAMAQLETTRAEALLLDSWLPDLEVGEFAGQMRIRHPGMDLLLFDGGVEEPGARSPRRGELLHALRHAQQGASGGRAFSRGDTAASAAAPVSPPQALPAGDRSPRDGRTNARPKLGDNLRQTDIPVLQTGAGLPLQGVIGASAGMKELARLVRLVAPYSAAVLIRGETGTGKELVAKAVHTFSTRASKPFVVINCAAIPESLIEAELFGHTRGAFTGAVQSRAGLVEAADGGTLFLDEIGEMPLAMQAKMLRFLEAGEIQRVGGNETMRIDARVVAATHQPLKLMAEQGTFRMDLYHRLAVFPITIPPLRERMEDIAALAAALLQRLGEQLPVMRLSSGAMRRLAEHDWPGNVRELAHVLERATILAQHNREITEAEIQI